MEQAPAALELRGTEALFVANAKGGEADKEAMTARDLCLARANLALAQADKPAAINELKLALKYAECYAQAVTVAYQTGTVTLNEVGEAGEERRQIELKLLALSSGALEEVNISLKKECNVIDGCQSVRGASIGNGPTSWTRSISEEPQCRHGCA
jgi:hypothetical protein